MKWFMKMNTPNKLTMCRMFCVIIMVILAVIDFYWVDSSILIFGASYSIFRLFILIVFTFGSITDYLDGSIARKYNLVTTFGKFMDPIADKMLVNSLFIILTGFGEIPWVLTLIFIARDLFVDSIRMICTEKQVVIAASNFGKLKTVLQMISQIAILVLFPFGYIYQVISIVLVGAAALVSLMSGIDYFIKNKKILLEGANYNG